MDSALIPQVIGTTGDKQLNAAKSARGDTFHAGHVGRAGHTGHAGHAGQQVIQVKVNHRKVQPFPKKM